MTMPKAMHNNTATTNRKMTIDLKVLLVSATLTSVVL